MKRRRIKLPLPDEWDRYMVHFMGHRWRVLERDRHDRLILERETDNLRGAIPYSEVPRLIKEGTIELEAYEFEFDSNDNKGDETR